MYCRNIRNLTVWLILAAYWIQQVSAVFFLNDVILQTKDTKMSKLVKVECEGVFGDEVDLKAAKKRVLFQKQNKDLQVY